MRSFARLRGAILLAALVVLAAIFVPGCAEPGERVALWHAYRGDEETALVEVVNRFELEHPGVTVELLAIPFEVYTSKLGSAIPHAHGPDVFIDAHERLGIYEKEHLVGPVGDALPDGDVGAFDATSIDAITLRGVRYGVPMSNKCLALYVNEALIPEHMPSIEAIAALRAKFPEGSFPLAYDSTSAFFHAPFLHAFGGRVLDGDRFAFDDERAARSVDFARGLAAKKVVPEEPSGALITQLFASGHVGAVINGPWFQGDLKTDVKYHIEPLPKIEAAGDVMRPYLAVEAAMLSPSGAARKPARDLARYLGGEASSKVRARVAKQVVARLDVWNDPAVAGDASLRAFHEAARDAVPMPTSPAMRATWVPVNQAILKVLRGDMSSADALREARARFEDVMRPPPPPPSPTPALALLGAVLLALAFAAVRRARDPGFQRELRASLPVYRWVAHAAVTVFALVLLPLAAGALTSFFTGTQESPRYVGFANYVGILTARGAPLLSHGSFYLTLLVTVAWTVLNVSFHVAIGLVLGLALSRPWLKVRAVYRVLLILPWAVPSYVTALAWKGMFHRQFGAINAVLHALGAEPVSWFSHFTTAFTANLVTNVWLGFPFMMVVTMGALTSIPKDVLEAAEVDGATRWQKLRLVTLPLLRPTLLPAVVLGAVWTFNMFNVVFLVSGGEPDGTTDILLSEAYRWAFTRDAQYGYAAAYAVLIFFLLVGGTRLLGRFAPRGEAT